MGVVQESSKVRKIKRWRLLLSLTIFIFGILAISIQSGTPDIWSEVVTTDGMTSTQTKRRALQLAQGTTFLTMCISISRFVAPGLLEVANSREIERLNAIEELQEGTRVLLTEVGENSKLSDWNVVTVRLYCVDKRAKNETLTCVVDMRH